MLHTPRERSSILCVRTLAAVLLSIALPALGGCANVDGGEATDQQSSAIVASAGRHGRRPTPVIFAHDADFDDMAALAYLVRLHKAGEIDLRLVAVTSAGTGLPGRAIFHTRCLLEHLGVSDIPVADSPAVGANPFPDVLRFTFDTVLTDVLPGCTASSAPSAVPAEQAIAAELERSREPVTIIATGPLTNVAGAFELRSVHDGRPLATRIRRTYFLGGAIDVPGGLCCGEEATFDGTQTFNVWGDPAAAQTVLDRLLPAQMTMIGAEASNHVPITSAYIARLGAEGTTPEAQWVHTLVSHPIIAFSVAAGLPVFWWDPLTDIAVTTRDVVQYRFRRIAVVQSGPSAGRTIEVGPGDDGAWVLYATTADTAGFEDAFLAGLNTPAP